MPDFSTVEDTLYVPMLGRIYASEHFPAVLNDRKALELKPLLPQNLKGRDTQTQYTLMASAVRSTNMDRCIQDFLKRSPDGVIVLLGCGLETTFFRNDNGHTVWYEVDLPDVIAYRKELLGESDRDRCIAADAFGTEWIETIRAAFPDAPVLVAASGLFYYFEYSTVVGLFKQLKNYGRIELLFDTVNSSGMKQMSKYMKQVGHADAAMYFYVDKARTIAEEIGGRVLREEAYYAHTPKKGLKLSTAVTMRASDLMMMVKMVVLALNF